MSQDSNADYDIADQIREYSIRLVHQRKRQHLRTQVAGSYLEKRRSVTWRERGLFESLFWSTQAWQGKYFDCQSHAEQEPVLHQQTPQHRESPSESDTECVVVFDSAGAEGTRANTRPRHEQTVHGVWTDKHFLNRIKAQAARNQTHLSLAAHYPLKRYKAQAPLAKATTLLEEEPTANLASRYAKTYDETADQLEVSTAAVGVADSDPVEKGRQNKRAEKAASKRHAFLQSEKTANALETTHAFETTHDDELLRELQQRNIILTNSLTTSGLPQASASVGELAALQETRREQWAECDARFEEFYTKPWPTAERPHGWTVYEASLRINIEHELHRASISRDFIAKWEQCLDVPLVYPPVTTTMHRPPSENEIVELMSEVFASSVENAASISMHTTKQDFGARIYAVKVWQAAEGKQASVQASTSERERQEAVAQAHRLGTFNANNRQVKRASGQKKKKPGRPKGSLEPPVETARVYLISPAPGCSADEFAVQCVDQLWRMPVTLRLPAVVYQDGYLELSKIVGEALDSRHKLPAQMPASTKGVFCRMLESVSRIARQRIRDQASRALSRLLAVQLPRAYPAFYESLQGMPVSLIVFTKIRVSFRLDFKSKVRRTLVSKDFGEVRKTVRWLQEQTREVLQLAGSYNRHCININKEQKEGVEKGSTKGQRGFERALWRLRNLLNGQDAKVEKGGASTPVGLRMTPEAAQSFKRLTQKLNLPAIAV